MLSAFGTFLGGMVHVFAAALGVSIVLAKSAVAFATVKYAGAAYLCFLGVRMILDARREKTNTDGDCSLEYFCKRSRRREIRFGRAWRLKF